MVDRYYNWFLQNYKFYSYVGPKARAVLKSIEVFIASNDPNIYNFHTFSPYTPPLFTGIPFALRIAAIPIARPGA